MQAAITRVRMPYETRLREPIAQNSELLYRRGNFNGSWDQLIVDALMQVNDAQIAFSPGFRWGTTLLPGQAITREDLMAQTAITYPDTAVSLMTGAEIRKTLEQLSDKLFNEDPYQHQGGDMLRTGGLTYTCAPSADQGARISNMRLNGQLIEADKSYKVARWGVGASPSGDHDTPIWDVVEQYLRQSQLGQLHTPNVPHLAGVEHNPGIAKEGAGPN